MKHNLFCYGTLMAPQIMQRIIGHCTLTHTPATLEQHGCFKVRNELFPGTKPETHRATTGVLYMGLTDPEITLLDQYEGQLYVRKQVTVSTTSGNQSSWCYLFNPEHYDQLLPDTWCF